MFSIWRTFKWWMCTLIFSRHTMDTVAQKSVAVPWPVQSSPVARPTSSGDVVLANDPGMTWNTEAGLFERCRGSCRLNKLNLGHVAPKGFNVRPQCPFPDINSRVQSPGLSRKRKTSVRYHGLSGNHLASDPWAWCEQNNQHIESRH